MWFRIKNGVMPEEEQKRLVDEVLRMVLDVAADRDDLTFLPLSDGRKVLVMDLADYEADRAEIKNYINQLRRNGA